MKAKKIDIKCLMKRRNMMHWKQFFTPVKSMNAEEARRFIDDTQSDALTILDVRQPEEYQAGHIPGATLIPLPQLSDRLTEIDQGKPTVVYCAIGGRSRVAAQMLAGRGFDTVYNLSGGFKAWNGQSAVGPVDLGLELFSGNESPAQALVVGWGLEAGLREFYLSMTKRSLPTDAVNLFNRLAEIETRHQESIFSAWKQATGNEMDMDTFARDVTVSAMEGGLTSEAYVERFNPDWSNPREIVGLAMSIEAQALDLYLRAADRAKDETAKVLARIAGEERAHLAELGRLMGSLMPA
jgi:sulfur-carrier protein adenylyltransferase/sulfurtransferase